jgi:hypothetical protein
MRDVNPVTRMLLRLNMIMRRFREKFNHPMLFVVDRIGNRRDAVVLIVDIFDEERERAEAVANDILNLLDSYGIKVFDHKLESFMVPFKDVWRFVAVVAVDNSQ